MSKPTFTLGFVRDLPRLKRAGQEAELRKHGVQWLYYKNERLVNAVRPASLNIVALYRLELLADPATRRKAGDMRKSMFRTLNALEKKGAVLWEISTNLRTDRGRERDTMIQDAIDRLARSKTGSDAGRPKTKWSVEQMRIMKLHWPSLEHRYDKDAWQAIVDAGVPISFSQLRHALGASGRARIKKPKRK